MPKIVNVNCETDEIVESEMTSDEHAFYQEMVKNIDDAAREAEIKESNRQSAMAKLKALCLSDAEVAALLGS